MNNGRWHARELTDGTWVVDRWIDGRKTRFGEFGANEAAARAAAINLNDDGGARGKFASRCDQEAQEKLRRVPA